MASYKKKSLDPDTVKKKLTFQGLSVHIDRPKGFVLEGKDREGRPWKKCAASSSVCGKRRSLARVASPRWRCSTRRGPET